MERRLRQQSRLGLMTLLQMHCEVLDSIRKHSWRLKELMVMRPSLLKRFFRKQRKNSKCIRSGTFPHLMKIGHSGLASFRLLKLLINGLSSFECNKLYATFGIASDNGYLIVIWF